MRLNLLALTLLILPVGWSLAGSPHTWSIAGQAAAWFNVSHTGQADAWLGGRYLPRGNWEMTLGNGRSLGIEASVNAGGSTGWKNPDSLRWDGHIKAYRLWGRYASNRLEARIGLQKINFGSAGMLRPLMWFDQLDPRDPLQLTDGVWALLGRYFFLNNANMWLWVLYGNEGPRTWETGPTTSRTPEFGGRVQLPFRRGEVGAAIHHRRMDQPMLALPGSSTGFPGVQEGIRERIPETRYGLDVRLDVLIGLWMEAAWIRKEQDAGLFSNQQLFTLGADYTFGLGNGLYLSCEYMALGTGRDAFRPDDAAHFSAVSLSYPLGLFDTFSAILYGDWTRESLYPFVRWQHQRDRLGLHLMAFWNPESIHLPQQGGGGQLFAGKGLQLMLVYHH